MQNNTVAQTRAYSTEEAASRLRNRPATWRRNLCVNGHFMGIKPLAKLPNGRLLWPADIYRTSDVVLRLRKAGWPINTDDLPVKNTFREDCVVGLYSLKPEAIALAGQEGQQFISDEREVLRAMRRAA